MTTQSRPSIPMFLVHVIMTCITGGLWLVGLIIWHLMKK